MAFIFKKRNKPAINTEKENGYLKQSNFAKKLKGLIYNNKNNYEENFFDKMEELLISYDVGVETTLYIIDELKEKLSKNKSITEIEIKELLKEDLFNILPCCAYKIKDGLNILFILGVNGAGKTTSIAKLGNYFKNKMNKKVMFVAGDTFRAAAIEQLDIWADRLAIPIIKSKIGFDPGAVLHNSISKAQSQKCDVLIIDTAGRFHNRQELVAEIEKLNKIVYKNAPEAYIENLLVVDATTGQNGFTQTAKFKEHIDIKGVILTKFDSSAKGGIILPLAYRLNIPVKFIGTGEQIEDIMPFNRENYINELLY